jgi:hypothetical protein
MKHGASDPASDPFGERLACPLRARVRALGAVFEFESNARALLRLVHVAFDGLPAHSFSASPHCTIRLLLTRREGPRIDGDVPPMTMHAGAGVLCGTMNAANFAVVSPAARAALVAVSRSMLRHPYHVRYELIEFAVYTLASRAQELISTHAACIGHQGRGLLLIGASGAGKSTLSLHCLQQGMEFVAEDGVFVQPQTLHATGVGSFLHLPVSSPRNLLPEAADAWIRRSSIIRRRNGVEKFEIDVRRTGCRIARQPPELAGVVFLSRRRGSRGPLLSPLRKSELLEKLQASQRYAANQPGWAAFCRRICRLPAFELRRGRHPGEAAEALRTLVES